MNNNKENMPEAPGDPDPSTTPTPETANESQDSDQEAPEGDAESA